jgi:hypothetical protein
VNTPLFFREARLHSGFVFFMPTHKMMKTTFDKADRSVCHHFLASTLPFAARPEARLDVLGGVAVVSLSATILVLMRLLLAN